MTAPHNSTHCFLNISQPWLGQIIRTQICFLPRHSHTRVGDEPSLGIIIASFSDKHAPASETGAPVRKVSWSCGIKGNGGASACV